MKHFGTVESFDETKGRGSLIRISLAPIAISVPELFA